MKKKVRNVVMLSREKIILQEWLKREFISIADTLPIDEAFSQYLKSNTEFSIAKGLIARPNQMIGTNWYVIREEVGEETKPIVWIVASTPIFCLGEGPFVL